MVFWSCMELQDETTIHMLEHELQEAEAHHDDYERQVKALEGKLAEHQVSALAMCSMMCCGVTLCGRTGVFVAGGHQRVATAA